ALYSGSDSDLNATIPWDALRARFSAKGTSMNTAKLSMTGIKTRAVDGFDLIQKIETYKINHNVIRDEFRPKIQAFISEAAPEPSKITMRIVSEVYLASGVDVDIVFNGQLSGEAASSATLKSVGDDKTSVDVSSKWSDGFMLTVHRKFDK